MTDAVGYLAALDKPKPLDIWVERIDSRAALPTTEDIGWDVFAFNISESGKELTRAVHQRQVTKISTGIKLVPPLGFYFSIHSKIQWAERGVLVVNCPGLAAPKPVGELIIYLYNGSFETHYIPHGHRIAKLILTPIHSASLTILDHSRQPPGSS